ncbi:MAG TPA: NADAR family protein [Gemmataceae bacterium]|nr:NADAR family protein [Gemmataceae bacterium]
MATEAFTFFWKSPLSQWHRSPFVIGGISFTHAEQFMMYAKALLFGDHDAAAQILKAQTPREQQAIGRTVRGFDEAVWVLFREGIVYNANYARFLQNPQQRELLLATRGTTLVEASPHDQVWGIGLAADDPRALDRAQWRGLNLLGEVLTRVREALLWEQSRGLQERA